METGSLLASPLNPALPCPTSLPPAPSSLTRAPHAPPLPPPRFAERHKRLLNAYLRRNPALLESSLQMLLRAHNASRLIDFDNKRAYFRSKVRQHDERPYGTLRIAVRYGTLRIAAR